jgi:AcrR family transcriptional regulator
LAKGRHPRPADENTRAVVLNAAVETICDLGYYRASSNEIARRAGVSWGVINHYFGTREALLLAVLEDAIERALAGLSDVRVVGNDRRTRLRQLINRILSFYGQREYIAIMQILWNQGRDPRTEQSTQHALDDFTDRLRSRWIELFTGTIDSDMSTATANMVFVLMWGMAIQEAASAFMRHDSEPNSSPIELRIEMLLDALEGLLQHDRG